MQKILGEAKSCSSTKETLCSGEKLEKLQFESCLAEINKLDCLHKLISLSISKEDNEKSLLFKQYLQELERLALIIEDLEKSKKISEAEQNAKLLRPFISFAQDWQEMESWYSKKSINLYLLKNCESFKCTEEDKESILISLFSVKGYLTKDDQKNIEREIVKLQAQKELRIASGLKPKWKKILNPKVLITQLFNLSWEQLFNLLNKDKIKVYKIKSSYTIKELESYLIPKEKFEKIADLKDGLVPGDSKILNDSALAKFVTSPKQNSIIVTSLTTKMSLIHEYLHSLQVNSNPDYKQALIQTAFLKEDFNEGRLSKKEFEAAALKANVLIAIAELEIYKLLLNSSANVSQIENLNNKELFEKYKLKIGDL
ncbi:MAG: hypothetical protein AB7I27_17995 [Bacteriovoracaceae bacterium]